MFPKDDKEDDEEEEEDEEEEDFFSRLNLDDEIGVEIESLPEFWW